MLIALPVVALLSFGAMWGVALTGAGSGSDRRAEAPAPVRNSADTGIQIAEHTSPH